MLLNYFVDNSHVETIISYLFNRSKFYQVANTDYHTAMSKKGKEKNMETRRKTETDR